MAGNERVNGWKAEARGPAHMRGEFQRGKYNTRRTRSLLCNAIGIRNAAEQIVLNSVLCRHGPTTNFGSPMELGTANRQNV
jgi:hypothetical protein